MYGEAHRNVLVLVAISSCIAADTLVQPCSIGTIGGTMHPVYRE